MGMSPKKITNKLTWLSGFQRNILLTSGPSGGVQYAAFSPKDKNHLEKLKQHLIHLKFYLDDIKSPLFEKNCFSFLDPDGNRILFGLPKKPIAKNDKLPGRLQHVVFATKKLASNIKFYTEILGFRISDIVRKEETGDYTACFLRCDEMHHSIAFFKAPEKKLDHFANEANSWNDIRDWGDHFSEHGVEIIWGAGRHGAGNNLFIFVKDPDGNNIEISAELEKFSYEQKPRFWPHNHRALNLWGKAWMRS